MSIAIYQPYRSPYTVSQLELILEQDETDNIHGGTFTGRPTTKLVVHPEHVIKLRTEYTFNNVSAARYIEQAADRERKLNIYHPDKTWFTISGDDPEWPVIANVTPHLLALHRIDELKLQLGEHGMIEAFEAIFDIYLQVAYEHELGLDLSLSNFGITGSGKVYYLDDDVYDWDNFNSFSVFLANLIRGEEWINEEYAEELGQYLRQRILHYFNDKHWLAVIAEEVRDQFLPPALFEKRKALLRGLQTVGTAAPRESDLPPPQHDKLVALIADIHANAPAFEAVLNYLSKRGINEILVMGDVVGYGPHASQCVDMLMGLRGAITVMGNHDHAVLTGHYARGFSNHARWVIEWTMKQLNEEQLAWLDTLPPYFQADDWLALHGAPRDKTFFNAYVYKMTFEDNLEELERRSIRYCFHGHTHLPKIYYKSKTEMDELLKPHIELKRYQHALICPGSVGQPRGGEAGAELAIMDFENDEIEFHRFDYDAGSVLAEMEREHFPQTLIERLRWGK